MAVETYDVVIIGAGPGGYVCALRAAQLGLPGAPDAEGLTAGVLSAMRWAPYASWLVATTDLVHLKREALDWLLKPSGMSFQEFRQRGVLSGKKVYRHYEEGGFETPSARVELYSKPFKAWGLDPLPVYRELPETPYSAPRVSPEYPFVAVSRKSRYYRHSRDRQIPSLRQRHPEPLVRIHAETAESMGIREGDWVYIETKRGRIQQKAKLTRGVHPKLIEIDYAWYFPEKGEEALMDWRKSNINVLTSNRPPFNREMGSTNLRGFFCKVYK